MRQGKVDIPDVDEKLVQPPTVNKYLTYLKFLGPGAVVASFTIGMGQLILGSQVGAWGGFGLLWIITLSFTRFVIAYAGARFTLLSGLSIPAVFASIRSGVIDWLLFLSIMMAGPLWASALISSIGSLISWITGIASVTVIGYLVLVVLSILVILLGYEGLERIQLGCILLITIGVVISLFIVKPNLHAITRGAISFGKIPDYPSWVQSEYPLVAKVSPVIYVAGFFGTLGFDFPTAIAYLGWIKEKGWGIYKGVNDVGSFSSNLLSRFKAEGSIDYLPEHPDKVSKLKLSLRKAQVDIGLSWVLVAIASGSFLVAGASLMGPKHLLPSGFDLVRYQSVIYTNISKLFVPIYKISVLVIILGTAYAAFELVTRMLYETLKPISAKARDLSFKKIQTSMLVYLGITAPIPLMMNIDVVSLYSISMIIMAVIATAIYGLGVVFINQSYLPESYNMGNAELTIAYASVFISFMFTIIVFLA